MIWIVVAVVAVVAAVAVGLYRTRTVSGHDQFRRHIDALSPEARREVYERVQRSQSNDQPGPRRGPEA
jgi:flagellar basal body-associated protein FliL